MKKIAYSILILLILSSCFKEENPRDNNISNYDIVEIGSQYQNQIFYSLLNQGIVSSNDYQIWDIGLYCKTDKSFIRLNGAKNSYVIKTGSTDFNANYNIENYSEEERRYDGMWYIDGNLAIDEIILQGNSVDTLFTSKQVYLISEGNDVNGLVIGTAKKFVFEGIIENNYIIKYADLDGTNEVRKIIPRDETLNLIAFSFTSQNVVSVEPDKSTWDILYTRNTDTVFSYNDPTIEPIYGYAVTGAYLNPTQTEAYVEEDIAYKDINSSNIKNTEFTSRLNIIGHDWKIFTTQYTIDETKSYVIKDKNGFIYKLRFLGFYDEETGQKGYPSFEIKLVE